MHLTAAQLGLTTYLLAASAITAVSQRFGTDCGQGSILRVFAVSKLNVGYVNYDYHVPKSFSIL